MTQPTLADWLNGAPEAPVAPPPPATGDYAAIDAMNWSTLRHLATSALLLRWRVDHPREDTEALERGRRVHAAILEPDVWASRYVAQPDFGDMRTKVAKAARDEWLAALAPGVETLDAGEHALVERVARTVREHPAAAKILRAGRREEVVTWTEPGSGLACKSRLDFIGPAYVVDIKTTRAQTLRDIARDIASYLYHGQLAFYTDAAIESGRIPRDCEGPYVIAAQTVEPFDVVVGRLSPEDLHKGRALYRRLIDRYLACRAADWWPGLAPDVVTLRLPEWAAGGVEEETDW